MTNLTAIMAWAFIEEVPSDIVELLIEGGVAGIAYKTISDGVVLTNKAFIITDK